MKKSYGSTAEAAAAWANEGGDDSSSNDGALSSSEPSEDEDSVEEANVHYSPGRRPRSLSIQRKAELYDEQTAAADMIGELLAAAAESEEKGDPGAEEAARAADDLLRKSLHLSAATVSGRLGDTSPLELEVPPRQSTMRLSRRSMRRAPSSAQLYGAWEPEDLKPRNVMCKVVGIFVVAIGGLVGLGALYLLAREVVGPPNQPVGNYRILELQEGDKFFDYYNFYAGPDSVGSNGYITYVSKERAMELGIAKVVTEPVPEDERPDGTPLGEDDDDDDDGVGTDETEEGGSDNATTAEETREEGGENATTATEDVRRSLGTKAEHEQAQQNWSDDGMETFVYMSSAPTEKGPRESIRLEGKRRFNRGLFILDLAHMPAGCGVWPAFWLTDEANWPINGEIDIVEGVSYQSEAKTALHSTKGCKMDDVPNGVKTGTWDTAVGIPDKKTGIPDMTFRYAQDCYVYDPHQWINQGCVAVDLEGGTLGQPLNDKGGGVYALEWDPINRHIRTWVFTPHRKVPSNLMDSIRTAAKTGEEQVAPNPEEWGLPYGYFPIGDETSCPLGHFRNMRLVINMAFCGSVAGNRYFMDCPNQFKEYKTCNEWVKSNPKELEEAYWKIRGVYVYEREWEKQWT